MGRVNTPKLTPEQRTELENGFRKGKSHSFRMRCYSILLKAEGRSSAEVGSIVGMCALTVNHQVRRFVSEGIAGLHTKSGRGRKPLLKSETDTESVMRAITSHRQRLSAAKAAWESATGRQVSATTFRRFLKVLADDISAYDGDARGSRTPNSTSIRSNV